MQLRVVQLATLAAAAAAYRVPLAPLPAPTLATARPLPLAALPTSPRLAPPRCVASSPELDDKTLDAGALGRYVFAVLIQMVAVTTAFGFVDLACYGPLPGGAELGGPLPWQAVVGIFVAMSLRSRVFSPLDNSRPELRTGVSADDDAALRLRLDTEVAKLKNTYLREECYKRGLAVDGTMDRKEYVAVLEAYYERGGAGGDKVGAGEDRIMPDWTPPGVVFPLMWVGVVAPLRAFAASMIYEASTGRLNGAHLDDPVLLWLVFHLCVGDTWNTVNNVERRTGAAVPGVVLVWLTTLYAAKQFYDVSPVAGGLLGLTAVWITVAGALVADTWRINNAVAPEPLYPHKPPGTISVTRLLFEDAMTS